MAWDFLLLILLPLRLIEASSLSDLIMEIQRVEFPECSLIITRGSSGYNEMDAMELGRRAPSPIYQIALSAEFSKDLKLISSQNVKRCRSYVFLLHSTFEVLQLLTSYKDPFLQSVSFGDKVILLVEKSNIGLVQDITTSDPLFENLLYLVLIGYEKEPRKLGHIWDIYATQFFVDNKRLSYKYLGLWNSASTQQVISVADMNLFPSKMQDFYGQNFRISTFHFPPKVSHDPVTDVWSGVEIELARMIGKKLNFNPQFIAPEDGKKWGSFENGTYTGLMGDIIYRRADLGFCNLFITNDRLKHLDMTNAYHTDYACFLTPAPNLIPQYMAIVYPFDVQVWGSILLTFIILIPLTHLFLRKSPGSQKFGRFDSFWNMYCEFTAGFYIAKINTKNIYYKLFTGGVWAFVLIVTWSYKESIKAFLTVPARQNPINSLEQLVESNLKWGVRNSGGWPDWFKDSSDPLSRAIYEGFTYVMDNEEGIQKVVNGDYAFMNSRTFLEYLISSKYTNKYREKELHITSQCFVPFKIGLAMPIFSPYKNAFDKVIISTIEAGLIELWLDNSNLEAERKNRATHSTEKNLIESKVSAMSLHDIQGIFFIFGIGIGLAGISFGLEQLNHATHMEHG